MMGSSYAMDVWVRSGMAQEAARGLAWFVVLMLVIIGYVLWLDSRNDGK